MKTKFAPEHLLRHKPQDKILWDRSKGVLGHSWALLGRSWGVLGALWAALGALLGCSSFDLGRSWGAFGALLW